MGVLALALILDAIVGDPDWLWRRLPHPVVWFGKIIDWFDQRRDSLKFPQMQAAGEEAREAQVHFWAGFALLVVLLVLCVGASHLVGQLNLISTGLAKGVEVVLVAVLIAQRSLYEHVERVADALRTDSVEKGRQAVSMIVGRNVSQLDESGISKATIESLAENFSDGVVAPVLWYVVVGLPGILFYKAVNTADSMIGHRNARYEYFGKAAARLDDWMNWPAARLSLGLVLVVVALRKGFAASADVLQVATLDAPQHRSPNAGWPEAGFASALGVALGGNRSYGDEEISAVVLNAKGREILNGDDIRQALRVFCSACALLFALVLLFWLFG